MPQSHLILIILDVRDTFALEIIVLILLILNALIKCLLGIILARSHPEPAGVLVA
jgi:hypothetical protein